MSEKTCVIDHLTLTYSGLFDVAELYHIIDTYLAEKGYDKFERRNIHQVTPSGKHIELELNPWKTVSDYIKTSMKITIYITNCKDVEVEKDGVKVKLNQGNVQVIIDGLVITDHENKWNNNALMVFFRTLIDKYIMRSYIADFEGQVTNDVNQLHSQLKSFLNLYRY